MSVVLINVVSGGADFSRRKLPSLHPEGSTWHFGFSYYFAWFVAVIFFAACAAFLFYSRKKKGDKALSDDMAMADRPTIIGR